MLCFTSNIPQQFRSCFSRNAIFLTFKNMRLSPRLFTNICSILVTGSGRDIVSARLEPVCTGSEELNVHSPQLCIRWHLIDRWKSALGGVFTQWKLAEALSWERACCWTLLANHWTQLTKMCFLLRTKWELKGDSHQTCMMSLKLKSGWRKQIMSLFMAFVLLYSM